MFLTYRATHSLKKEKQHTTMHWQNTGRDVVTSSSAILRVWFGAGPFSLKLYWQFQHHVSIHHQHWAGPAMNSHVLRQCKPLAAIFQNSIFAIQIIKLTRILFTLVLCLLLIICSSKGQSFQIDHTISENIDSIFKANVLFDSPIKAEFSFHVVKTFDPERFADN